MTMDIGTLTASAIGPLIGGLIALVSVWFDNRLAIRKEQQTLV